MSQPQTLSLEGGFADLVGNSQTVFRAAMNALSRPGLVQALDVDVTPPSPLTPELAALTLALADHDSPIWLDPTLAASEAVTGWLKFHTGAPIVAEPDAAQFALIVDVAEILPLTRFALGTDQYPDRSTTLLVAVDALTGGAALTLAGPGVKTTETLAIAGLPAGFAPAFIDNREEFPRGVDLLFAAYGQVIGLPRSTRLSEEN
jgi:alpha-D-ribose 1-methylphosphonate 5-triphosphate synthase subunit PhnH